MNIHCELLSLADGITRALLKQAHNFNSSFCSSILFLVVILSESNMGQKNASWH